MAKKTTRKRWALEEKRRAIQGFVEARNAEPTLTLVRYAEQVGIQTSMLTQWSRVVGIDISRATWEARALAPAPEAAAPDAPAEPSKALAPMSDWVSKHGAALREGMGLTPEPEASTEQTQVSTGPLTKYGKRRGRPTDAERERRAAQKASGLAPYQPRQVSMTPPDTQEDERQASLPFRAEPPRREQQREQPQAPNEFYAKVTEQALKERDAVMTVLQMMIRENGGKLPGL